MKSNFPKSVVEKNDYGDVTYRKVFGPKWPALVAFTLALLSDLFAFIYVLVKGGGFSVFIFPLLLFVMTAVMLTLSVFTDYRFKYSLLPVVIYIVLSAVTMALFTYVTVANVDVTVSTFGYIFLGATYILTYVFCTVSVFGGNGYAPVQRRRAGICTALLTLVSAFSIFGYFTFGFYGQGIGIFDEEMVLVYNYDAESDSYSVKGILAGRGDTLTIPAEFNGKTVSKVSCDLFLHSGITTVRIEDGAAATLIETQLLDTTEIELLPTVYANVDLVNHYRQQFFDYSVANDGNLLAMSLCNSFRCDIDESKTEIHFEYDMENFPLGANPQFIPVFVRDKGVQFNLSDFVQDVPYFGYIDPATDAELAKAYSEISGYCLYDPTLVEDATVTVDGTKLDNEIYRVSLKFDRVYLIDMEDGNDTKYLVPDEFKQTQVGSVTYDGMFVRASALTEYLSTLPERNGFTVGYTVDGQSVKGDAQTLSAKLESKGGTATLVPTWEVVPPVINSLVSDKSGYVYGDEKILLTANVSCVLDVRYTFTYVNGSQDLADGVENNYTVSNPIPANAGTYKVAVYVQDDSTSLTCTPVTRELAVSVAKKTVVTTWNVPDGQIYNTQVHGFSTEITPEQAVGSDVLTLEMLLKDGEADNAEVLSVVNAGRYQITASFENPALNELYTISNPTVNFSILKYDAEVTWNADTAVYDGAEFTPTVTVKGVEDVALGVSLISNPGLNAGSYTAEFDFNDELDDRNYNVSFTHGYTITPKPITANYGVDSFVYNADKQWVSVTSFDNLCAPGDVTVDMVSYTGMQTNAGSYTVTAILDPSVINYTLTNNEKSYTITPLAITVNPEDYTKTYDGATFSAFVMNVVGGLPGNDNLSEIVKAFNWGEAEGKINVRADGSNSYAIQPSVKQQGAKYGNYTITFGTAAFTITQRALNVSAVNKTHTYNGRVFQSFTVTPVGLASGDTLDQVVSAFSYGAAASAINKGTYTIAPSVATQGAKYTNYAITMTSGTLTINPKALTVTADNKTKTYDTSPYSGFTVTFDGLAETDTRDEVATYGFGSVVGQVNAGSYDIQPELSSQGAKYANYTITVKKGTLTINKYAITIAANAATKTYDGYGYTGFTVTDPASLPGSDLMSEIIVSYSFGAAENGINAGSYTITPSAKVKGAKYDNYSIKFNTATLLIEKRALNVSVDDITKIYDKQAPSFNVTGTGLASTDNLAQVISAFNYGEAANKLNVGTYAITLSVRSQGAKYKNYDVSFTNGQLVINAKDLTVTAKDVTKTYEGKTFTFEVTASGLVAGDTLAQVISAFNYGEAQTAKNAGSYVIAPSTKTQGSAFANYDITFVNGTLTINKKDLVVSADISTATYSGAAHQMKVKSTGLVTGDTLAEVVTSFTYGEAATAVNAGTYAITLNGVADGAKSGNYNVSYQNGSFTITPRALTVTPTGKTVTYSGKTHALGCTHNGLVGGDTIDQVITSFSYGAAATAFNAGTYTIDMSASAVNGAKAGNYQVTFASGVKLVIQPKALTITVSNATKVADGNVYTSFNVSANGLVEGDTLAQVISAFSYGAAGTATDAGTYKIELGAKTKGAKYDNYKITFVNAELTITAPAVDDGEDDN